MKKHVFKPLSITIFVLFVLTCPLIFQLISQAQQPSPSDPCFSEKVTKIQRQNDLKDAEEALQKLLDEGAMGYVTSISQSAAAVGWGSAFAGGLGGLIGGGPGGAAVGFGTGLFTGSIIGGIGGYFDRKNEIDDARDAVEDAKKKLAEAETALESCKARNPNHIFYE